MAILFLPLAVEKLVCILKFILIQDIIWMADFSESFSVARFLLVISRKTPLGCHLSIIQTFWPKPGSMSVKEENLFSPRICAKHLNYWQSTPVLQVWAGGVSLLITMQKPSQAETYVGWFANGWLLVAWRLCYFIYILYIHYFCTTTQQMKRSHSYQMMLCKFNTVCC